MAAPPVPTPRGGAKPRVPSPPSSSPRRARPRAVPKLREAWKAEADAPSNVYKLPLSALLLTGLTYSADEGPAVDVLWGVVATLEGYTSVETGDQVSVPVLELTMLVRRVQVAMELVRRGAGAW